MRLKIESMEQYRDESINGLAVKYIELQDYIA